MKNWKVFEVLRRWYDRIRQEVSSPQGRRVMKAVGMFLATIGILCVVSVVILAVGGLIVYHYVFSDFQPQTEEIKKENIAISPQAPKTELYHVAVFGIDNLDSTAGRADSVMIFTIDKDHKQLKLTSLLRDSYLPIKDHGQDKLNHAYAYGGAELMLHTINNNFGLNVQEYVALNFRDVITVVDRLGGLYIEINEEERVAINNGAKAYDTSSPYIDEPGTVLLNGAQVVTYVRIRKIDDEVSRSGRQRYVIQRLADKLKGQHITDYPKLLHEFLPLVETSLTEGELLALAVDALSCDLAIKQYVLPSSQDNAQGGSYNGFWCWRYDIEAASKRWHDFLETKVE